jgi:8-oxo-dGTP diphosphatase
MSDYDPNYIPKKTYILVGQKAIILNNQNQILVLQRSEKSGKGGMWSLPGGGLEFKEEPFESIKREIKEETQLDVIELKLSNLRTYVTDENDFVLIIGYQCQPTSENIVLNWEHDSYKWLTKEEALNLDLTEDGRFFIENFTSSI